MQAHAASATAVASDLHVFGDANHHLLVVGSAEEGFRLWCNRCDRLGEQIYGSFVTAQHSAAAAKKDIAPTCRSTERSA